MTNLHKMPQVNSTFITGRIGEDIAVEYLVSKGVDVVCRNYRKHRGELDIVGWDGSSLTFYEVKTLSNRNFLNSPAEAVTAVKLSRIIHTARMYMYEVLGKEIECTFNLVSIMLPHRGDVAPDIQIVPLI